MKTKALRLYGKEDLRLEEFDLASHLHYLAGNDNISSVYCDRNPSLLIVTDIDDARLARAEQILSPEGSSFPCPIMVRHSFISSVFPTEVPTTWIPA